MRDYKENYETLVYGKGAEFFATLRDELGPATFDRLLRTYLERYRWRIATPAEFQALAEEVSRARIWARYLGNGWRGPSKCLGRHLPRCAIIDQSVLVRHRDGGYCETNDCDR